MTDYHDIMNRYQNNSKPEEDQTILESLFNYLENERKRNEEMVAGQEEEKVSEQVMEESSEGKEESEQVADDASEKKSSEASEEKVEESVKEDEAESEEPVKPILVDIPSKDNPENFGNDMTEEERLKKGRDLYGGDVRRYPNGMMHYSGVLGMFDYDPKEFNLRLVCTEGKTPDDPEFAEFPILAYVGKETDGSKIKIPEGLVDGSMMFAENKDLKSIPELPSSMKIGFAMFRNCENATRMENPVLPDGFRDGQFMFSDCKNLRKGPNVIPSSMRDGTAMFLNCENIRNTPKFEEGILCTDMMLANCKSLHKKPELPDSVMFNDYMTYGCSNIDVSEKAKSMEKTELRQEEFDSKMDRKSFGSRVGSVFSAVMQYHYLRTRKYSIVNAFLTTREKRKEGTFSKDMSSGWKALYNTNKKGLGGVIVRNLANSTEKHETAARQNIKNQKERFSSLNRVYKEGSSADYLFYNKGSQDAVKKLDRLGKTGYVMGTDIYADTMNRLDALEESMREEASKGTLSFHKKKEFAYEMIELMSNQESYYKGAENVAVTTSARRGLNMVNKANMSAILDKTAELQSEFQFMNERQLDVLAQSASATSYANYIQSEAGQIRFASMKEDFRKSEAFIKKGVNEVKLTNTRQDFIERRGLDRGKITDERFGFIGNQAQDVAEKASDGYEM